MRSGQHEYYCKDCDFYVMHDPRSGTYGSAPGRTDAAAKPAVKDVIMNGHGCLEFN
jgi:hypothetical protein